jgi:hypothetical protein
MSSFSPTTHQASPTHNQEKKNKKIEKWKANKYLLTKFRKRKEKNERQAFPTHSQRL